MFFCNILKKSKKKLIPPNKDFSHYLKDTVKNTFYTSPTYEGINSLCKMFSDYTSLFSKVYDIHKSASKVNDDLEKICYWTYQWKMQFNPDPNKQGNEVIFSQKQVQITYHIHLSILMIITFLNAPMKSF